MRGNREESRVKRLGGGGGEEREEAEEEEGKEAQRKRSGCKKMWLDPWRQDRFVDSWGS